MSLSVALFKAKAFSRSRYRACHYCKRRLTRDTATVDHVIPRSKGGASHPRNYVLACARCNLRKGDGLPDVQDGLYVGRFAPDRR